ncbi:uncharacterized protein LOC111714206 [Eurytemora carolleeae]|uniref:uncharacterized protein LOC111714206 n=1 Tax=Eurytemora carolleeae TaxID=1294199 RepID=UPI000C778CFA|nr:uncharacterized protein LOC111714206 [Eurytemora carolleeae]|eukprot:XP_023345031.1 uncharacterized protein LOC111714206 [Eurytemora affinis]
MLPSHCSLTPKEFGSYEASMFQQDPKMFQITRNDQLNPEDIHFFSGLVTSWRKLLLKTYLDGMSHHTVHEELERYHSQSLDTQTLTFVTALDCTLVDVSVDNIFKACLTDLSSLNPTMQAKLRTLYQCFGVFYSSANEGITVRQLLATYGYNVESYPFSAVVPVYMQDTKMVNYLKSDMFKSPWAESIEVEEFFMKTCQTLKTFLANPVLHLCFFNLILCNLADKFGSSHNFLPGKLKTILFKEMLMKSQDSNLANHRFTQLISTVHDVEECARILERATLIKETHIDLQDIDVVNLE